MQNAADYTSFQSDNRSDNPGSIISSLGSLLEQVRASMKLIEAAIDNEASPGNQETAANIFVLDDVTPGYVRANDALSACNASLAIALHFLRDVSSSKPKSQEAKGWPVDSMHCA
jgi:hypothetical protein